jgi:spore germination protein (amino acid permease)
MSHSIPERLKVSPLLVFFLINSIQIGIGVLSFQSSIIKNAGYDAWISIIIAGLGVHLLIWMMYKMLNKEKTDIFDIQKKLFGKWIGGAFGVVFVLYYFILSATILRLYIEIIQVWMFPAISVFVISVVLLLLVFYIVDGGFRVVTGICFLGVVIPLYLIFTLLFPLEFAHYHNLMPIFNHSIKDLLLSAKQMTLSFLGFTILFVFYPLIKHPEKSQKWAHLSVVLTILLYLATALVAFVYYDEEQLKTVIWPTLGLWKIIEMPFVERFEYIGISSWALVILPNMTLALWAASRGVKRIFRFKQRKALIVFLILNLLIVNFLKTHEQIKRASDVVTSIGFYIIYGYVPILFVYFLIYQRVRKSK